MDDYEHPLVVDKLEGLKPKPEEVISRVEKYRNQVKSKIERTHNPTSTRKEELKALDECLMHLWKVGSSTEYDEAVAQAEEARAYMEEAIEKATSSRSSNMERLALSAIHRLRRNMESQKTMGTNISH